MTSTSVETQGQKAAIATDATWDTESQFSVENQINQDQGSSLGTTLQNVMGGASKDSITNPTSSATTTASITSSSSETIPTGLDAIKAAGPQSQNRTVAYSEH